MKDIKFHCQISPHLLNADSFSFSEMTILCHQHWLDYVTKSEVDITAQGSVHRPQVPRFAIANFGSPLAISKHSRLFIGLTP